MLAGDLGLGNICLEGDAKLVTDALAGNCSPPISIHMIIKVSKGGVSKSKSGRYPMYVERAIVLPI